jgi:enoyl-CoA hydratase/carnithine racemase
MSDLIAVERAERVLTIRLNRPDKKNALTQAMYLSMAAALEDAKNDGDIRVVLFAGHPSAFSAGNDLQDFMNAPQSTTFEASPVGQFMLALAKFPKPVVTAVDGVAIGIGVTLLLHSDLVYAGRSARFQLPFVNLGICAEYASSLLMPRIMGHVRASELLLFGEPFTAETAFTYGLINAVLADGEVEAHARERAIKLAAQAPNAVRVTKMLLKHWTEAEVMEALTLEASHFVPMLKQPEALEALTAFMKKRKPDFSKFA